MTSKLPISVSSAVFSLLLALSGIPGACAAAHESWSSQYEQGQNALTQQNLANAEEHFRKALDLVQQQHNDTDIANCYRKLACTLALRGKSAEAQGYYQSLLSIVSKKYGADSVKTAPVLIALGSLQESVGDHTTAMTYYKRALQINERNYGPDSLGAGISLHRLGVASHRAGDKANAATYYKRSMSSLSQQAGLTASQDLESLITDYSDLIKGNDNSNRDLINDFQADIDGVSEGKKRRVGGNSNKLAGASGSFISSTAPIKSQDTLAATGAIEPSLTSGTTAQSLTSGKNGESAWQQQSTIQRDASMQSQTSENSKVAMRELSRPNSDASLSTAFNYVNDSVFKQNRYEFGEDNYKRSIATDIDALGPSHPSVANDLVGLAQLYTSQKKYSQAKPLFVRALSIYENAYGSNNILSINARAALANVEFHLGNSDEASKLYREALNYGQGTLGPNSPEIARILNELAYLYYHQGKLDDARTVYEWALASTEGASGGSSPQVAACLKDYAQVLNRLGRNSDAVVAEERADKILSTQK